MAADFQVEGTNAAAPFTLKVHRGDGMALLAMNWRSGKPPRDFIGFAIEYEEPGGAKFFPLNNRLNFPGPSGAVDPKPKPMLESPLQKFRWVHFPRNAEMAGDFTYRVTPMFMNAQNKLTKGPEQTAAIELRRETYPGQLNVTFTRGFVTSQAFVDRYQSKGPLSTLLPARADDGLVFVPTHPQAAEALTWMGFEARSAILDLLDKAVADANARVRVIAYDLSEPEVVTKLERLGARLKAIIDNSGTHGKAKSAESQAAARLNASGAAVKRQKVGGLQHNKTIAVDGPNRKAVICGSTNLSWRGLFVQSNNALVLRGEAEAKAFFAAFDEYWNNGTPSAFGASGSAGWTALGLAGIDARVAFSPHSPRNAQLAAIAKDVRTKTTSSLLYSLAFLYQTPGAMRTAIKSITSSKKRFVYGISDRKVGGLDLQKPSGKVAPVFPAELSGDVPEPFKSEPTGGSGVRMHHKFLVLDFDRPTARVYLGSYNFSKAADLKNGENLVLIKDRRVAASYAIEALRIFDHWHFRVARREAKKKARKLQLAFPPRKPTDKPWWNEYYSDARKARDRTIFA